MMFRKVIFLAFVYRKHIAYVNLWRAIITEIISSYVNVVAHLYLTMLGQNTIMFKKNNAYVVILYLIEEMVKSRWISFLNEIILLYILK